MVYDNVVAVTVGRFRTADGSSIIKKINRGVLRRCCPRWLKLARSSIASATIYPPIWPC